MVKITHPKTLKVQAYENRTKFYINVDNFYVVIKVMYTQKGYYVTICQKMSENISNP